MRDVNHRGHVGKGHVVVALHEHYLLGARFENIFQAALQGFPGGLVLINLESRRIAGAVVNQLHHNGAIRCWRWLFLILRRRLRHQGVQTLGRQRRDHHENDQQHQQNVNQRRDVHVRVLAPFGARCHTHNRSPELLTALFASARYCPPVGGAGGVTGGALNDPDFFCSVKRPSWSTPVARTSSTTSTTQPNFARASAFRNTRLSVRFARRSLSFWVRSSGLIGSVPKKTLSSRVIATCNASSLSASCISSGLLTWAMSTCLPCCNMGVTTMKMINSTSITSTIGVTLMSELTLAASFLFANAMKFYLLHISPAPHRNLQWRAGRPRPASTATHGCKPQTAQSRTI